jgi:putative ABC transport system permease protein
MTYIPLGAEDLAVASLLLLLDGALALWLRLGVARRLAIAAGRMVVQLLLMALVLDWLFTAASPGWTALAVTVMILFAGGEITARQDRPLAGPWSWGLGTFSIFLAAVLVTVFALTTAVRPDPWYDPRYALPLLGMILGNTMNGVALGLTTLTTLAVRDRAAIEARLCLGAPCWEALRPVAVTALRHGLITIINAMSGAGLVFIPGMMTGQIIAGAPPLEAAKYQILIMVLIAGGTAIGALSAVLLGAWRLTDSRHRLRLDHLAAPNTRPAGLTGAIAAGLTMLRRRRGGPH